ncbi:MAG TPA: S-methyl-5-thioribose-1-phosphate isomerase [Bacillota bacterium]|nr:S-methyl-5-thioribose-1-phosphate isomerase [Bacillota bacterium]HQD19693.1 S-methyl-5-thioribose-1-phosphate isomerase [Bacillota bacterium]
MKYETLAFDGEVLRLLDQRKLPGTIEFFTAKTYKDVEYAIAEMVVRGAPAIGAAAAFGVYLAAAEYADLAKGEFHAKLAAACQELAGARPTAVNLTWAIQRMLSKVTAMEGEPVSSIVEPLLEEAKTIVREDVEINKAIARHGNEIVAPGATILTHCNTGSLATAGGGTALGVIMAAHNSGKNIEVYVDETRPLLQGARLTAFELMQAGVPATLIVDSVAATLMREDKIDLVLVGADRIAANGDTANKIGTYMLSELAGRFGVPFYVVAPTSSIDLSVPDGSHIVIEERSAREVTHIGGLRIAPEGIKVYNPAFDITPHGNINGIVTEKGIIRPHYARNVSELLGAE